MEEKLSSQAHDPSVTLLLGGGWGRVNQMLDGGFVVEYVEASGMESDEALEVVVNERAAVTSSRSGYRRSSKIPTGIFYRCCCRCS